MTKVDRKPVLILILVGYALLGSLYAVLTPAWQVPDEPAHYNYIRHLAEEKRLPRLEAGDYSQALIEQLLSDRFPPSAPLDDLKYESHQPPLYYLLAVPVYQWSNGSLTILRLFSLVLASGIILLAHAVTRRIYPHQPLMAFGASAFVAFLPQHNAMMAGVNNDGLAGLFSAALLFLSVRILQGTFNGFRHVLVAGVVLGLGLLTKATVYPMAALVLAALCGRWWSREDVPLRHLVAQMMVFLAAALLIVAPWWIRNAVVYGWPDLLGLIRHDLVVEGQARTTDWIGEHGSWSWFKHWLTLTIQSFWGQFGWMSAPLDFRAYYALALVTALALLGCALPESQLPRRKRAPGIYLLVLQFVLALLAYLAYNAVFIQPQGRYLFTAVIPVATVFAFGLYRLSAWPRRVSLALFIFMLLMIAHGLVQADVKGWYALITACFAVALWIVSLQPRRQHIGMYTVAFGALFLTNLHAIFLSPLPALG